MSDWRTRRWLMREVHGVEIARERRKSVISALGNKPARDWKYRAWIRSLPCASCGLDPAGEAAHTGNDGGMSQKASDYTCVPLCRDCHTLTPYAYHRIGKTAFEVWRNVSLADLVKRFNRLWFHPRRSEYE